MLITNMKLPFKIAIIGLGLGLLFDWLFFETGRLGINLLIAELLFLGGSYLVAKVSGHRLPHRADLAAVFALAFAGTFALWTSSYGLTVGFLGFLIANLLFIAFAIGHEAHFYHPLEIAFAGTFDLSIRLLSRFNIFSQLKPSRVTLRQSSIIKGLIFLAPIFLIFIALFASADAVFASYLGDIFDWIESFTDLPRLIQHFIVIVFFTTLFTLFFAAAFWQRFEIARNQEPSPRFYTESKVMLAGIVVLFATFLVIQATTLFGGEAALRSLDITYSQYARSGFNQLIIVAVLVAAVVLTLRSVHGSKCDRRLRGLHLVLIVETLLVLVSALLRMNLYVSTYGYTPARIFSYWVMATIAILLMMLGLNIARCQAQTEVMRRGLVFLGICAFLFTASAPDAATVALNARQFAQTGKAIDATQFELLSAEAVPYINKVFAEKMTIEGLLEPQPSLEEYCVIQQNAYLENDRNLAVIKDLAVRQSIDRWYKYNGQTQWSAVGPDWREWNYSRFQLPTEPYGIIFIDDYSPVPAWVNAPYAEDPARLYEVCNQ